MGRICEANIEVFEPGIKQRMSDESSDNEDDKLAIVRRDEARETASQGLFDILLKTNISQKLYGMRHTLMSPRRRELERYACIVSLISC